MPSLTVALPDEHAATLARLVATGRYASEREALGAALRLLEARADDPDVRRAAFEAAIAEGEAALARGDYVTSETEADIHAFVRSLAAEAAGAAGASPDADAA